MANPTTKQELLTAIADGYAKLNEQIDKDECRRNCRTIHIYCRP